LSPSIGPSSGGTVVTVTATPFNGDDDTTRIGYGEFIDRSTLTCRFDDSQLVPAVFKSKFEVECEVPSHAEGTVTVSVSNNGVDFGNGLVFLYTGEPFVEAIYPSIGSIVGGLPLSVKAGGLPLASNLVNGVEAVYMCRFTNTNSNDTTSVDIAASYSSINTISCPTPPSTALNLPVNDVSSVQLRVSSNAVDFSKSFALFLYAQKATVNSFSPKWVPEG
jgi:hypothetical protein